MADRRFEPNPRVAPCETRALGQSRGFAKSQDLRESGEIILLTLTMILGLLWAIVLVTHFHGPLSSFGQSLWLMR